MKCASDVTKNKVKLDNIQKKPTKEKTCSFFCGILSTVSKRAGLIASHIEIRDPGSIKINAPEVKLEHGRRAGAGQRSS